FVPTKHPHTKANPKGVGVAFHDGASPFIMKADGKGWLFAPNGLVDGPLPTHYEPSESPVRNVVYPNQQNSPVALRWEPRWYFKLTDESLASLGHAGVPEGLLSKLRPLKDQVFLTEVRFVRELARLLGEEEGAR